MNPRYWHALQAVMLPCLLASITALTSASASAQAIDFSFGAIGQAIKTPNEDAGLVQAIADSDNDDLAFVVADGFKRMDEPCSDELYQRRQTVLSNAKNGLILSLTSADWSECKTAEGRTDAVGRLSRLRELFFGDEFSMGASKIPVMRQSNEVKFRSYVENARWEVGNILFATVNLPANNNHYRMEAGRNSEFEDRQIANRHWLQRLFGIATSNRMAAVVLFCDGDPLAKPGAQHLFDANTKRDGFAEIRLQLNTLASKFPGKLLLIHNRVEAGNAGNIRNTLARADRIAWHGNLGELELDSDWVKVNVKPRTAALFTSIRGGSDFKAGNQ